MSGGRLTITGKEDDMAGNGARKFFILVMEMRNAQKAFYEAEKGTEDRSRWYKEAKRLEKEVDAYISKYAKIAMEQEGRERFAGLVKDKE